MDPLKQLIVGDDSSVFKLRNLLSIAASVTVSFLILYGIIQAKKTGKIEEDPGFEELRSVAILTPPPPPPEIDRQIPTPPPPSLLSLEISPMENPLQLAYSLAPVSSDMSPPKIEPIFDFSPDAFKPTLREYKSRHVFSKADVDQPPKAVYKKIPEFKPLVTDKTKYGNVRLMYIVNTDGKVEAVSLIGSGGKNFDQVVMEGVKKWRFKPAIKDGQKVDCWVRQRVMYTPKGNNSPFQI